MHSKTIGLALMMMQAEPGTGIDLGARVSAQVRRGLPFDARYELLQREVTSLDDPPEGSRGRIHVDAEGRTRIDQETENLTIIADPVARLTTLISAAENRVMWQGPIGSAGSEPSGDAIESQPAEKAAIESLGTKTIEGQVCRGSRFVSGTSEIETWIADELGVVVLERELRDGREATYRLFDLRRITPEPSLFEVQHAAGGAHQIPANSTFAKLRRLIFR